MTRIDDEKILATIPPDQFVCRERESEQIWEHAHSEVARGLAILSAPGAGTTELLQQTFDRLFRESGKIIPVYFALKPTDPNPHEVARRYLLVLLTQIIAFRRGDRAIIDAAPDFHELVEFASASDREWIDKIIATLHSGADFDGGPSTVRNSLSAILRVAALGLRVFVLIDDLDHAALMPHGDAFITDLGDIHSRLDMPYIFAGARRFLFAKLKSGSMHVTRMAFRESGAVAEAMGSRFRVGLNEQTRDLIAVQLGGNLQYMNTLFEAAADCRENFDSFRSFERIYAGEIFGGRISRSIDTMLESIIPHMARTAAIRLLHEGSTAIDGKTSLESWRERLELSPDRFESTMGLLNTNEIISYNSGYVKNEMGNSVLSDYIEGRARLEIARDSRAAVVGEALTKYLKRSSRLLGRLYRRNAAVGLKHLLSVFDCQEIAVAAIDYHEFRDQLKGLSDAEIDTGLDTANHKLMLPQIVFTADTAAFYPQIRELIEDERSVIALGFAESSYREETVWIAAEIDSKMEADRDLTEYWCDRLEMAAITCGFGNYKLWLIAPEGFSEDACDVLRKRCAHGSCRRQVEILSRRLSDASLELKEGTFDEYEIIVPMGDDSEMIAAHTVEEIARKHNLPAKMINQIKTALVEACINASEHSLSPDRRIHQKFSIADDRITVTVANRGIRLLDANVQEIVPDAGRRGWGLKLMKGLMDEVKIEQSDDGTRISMVKYLRPSEIRSEK